MFLEKYIDAGGHPWGPSSTLIHSSTMDKVASACHTPESLLKVIEGLRERPEGVYVLLTALGAYEYWGVNRNGDAFPEWSLKSLAPPKDVQVYLDTKVKQALPNFVTPSPMRYGTRTFETDAHVYVLHENKDPMKAIGDVIAAAYNERMHRAELIVFIYEARDPEAVKALREGRDVAFSMGARLPFDVCLVAGTPILTEDGYTAIEDVGVEDQVLTHRGRFRPITRLYRRRYTGTRVDLRIKGLSTLLQMTHNHPVLIYPKDQVRNSSGRRLLAEEVTSEPVWVDAERVQAGDYVVIPKAEVAGLRDPVDQAYARLCGYYLGDGHTITGRRGGQKDGERVFRGISICSFAEDQGHIDRVVATLRELTEADVHVYPAGEDRQAVQIQVHDSALAARLAHDCGRLKGKRVPPALWSSPVSVRLALLGGLLDTDGHVDPVKKSSRIVGTLTDMLGEVQMLAISCGIPCTASARQSTSTYGTCYATQLSLGVPGTAALCDHSVKAGSVGELNPRWSATFLDLGQHLIAPVQAVAHEDVEDLPVFNIAVDEDESYVAAGVAVHNCSICFNIARTRTQYCDHLTTAMNQTYRDGRKVFAYNWFPLFFDISKVRVPADRSAWSLRKVAGYGITESGLAVVEPTLLVPPTTELTKVASILGGVKTSSLVKKTPTDSSNSLGSTPIDPQLARFVRDQVVRDDCESDAIADPQLDEGLRREGLKRVLSALALAGIILKPKELARAKKISGEEVPKSLDLSAVPPKLITIVRVHVPQRSLRDPKFSERRKEALASARIDRGDSWDLDADYRRYLDTLCESMESIIKEGSSASTRVLLDPDWMGRSLFKTGARSDGPREWIPFMAAATRHRWSGAELPVVTE